MHTPPAVKLLLSPQLSADAEKSFSCAETPLTLTLLSDSYRAATTGGSAMETFGAGTQNRRL